jgi:valyl-tRNA synthetase
MISNMSGVTRAADCARTAADASRDRSASPCSRRRDSQEQARLKKEIAKVDAEIAKVIAKLSNEAFVSKAPPEIIEENRERQASFEAAKAKLTEALARLSAA